MFFVLGLLFVLAGCIPLFVTLKRRQTLSQEQFRKAVKRGIVIIGIDIVVLILINIFFRFYTEFLWFQNLGYHTRFLIVLQTKIILFIVTAAIGFLFYFFNYKAGTRFYTESRTGFVAWPAILILTVILGVWGSGLWDQTLLYLNRASSQISDPIFGQSMSFYLFTLSFLSKVIGWIAFLLISTLLLTGILTNTVYKQARSQYERDAHMEKQLSALSNQLLLVGGLLFLLIAFNTALGVFRLMHSEAGVVTGMGWTDVHFRTVGHYIGTAVFGLLGIVLIVGMFAKKLVFGLFGLQNTPRGIPQPTRRTWIFPSLTLGVLIIANAVLPGLVQSVIVSPNEITRERDYIANNIEFTRQAYGIGEERIEEKTYNIGRDISPRVTSKNQSTLENVRLWDWRALMSNLQQQQEIRLYYQFHDVDIDRYMLDNEYREVMLSVRELEKSELAQESQTWVSRHLKYTHGYGLVLLPAHEFLPQGRPKLLVRGVPPEVLISGIQINRPEIYYGERTREHVYVNTQQEEFDYPKGDENVYTTYEGKGGVTLDTAFKRFVYAWKFDAHTQLFSGYITRDTKLMFNRRLRWRAKTLAPFLQLSEDPYAVITDNGRIKFILDAFMVSDKYPYSENYRGSLNRFHGLNYMRNSVKIVIDAYDGTTTFYAVEPDEILLKTYQNIFPDLFTPMEEMPEDIKRHIRYPAAFFNIQAEMYRTYHMTDVNAFYQREDVWEFATEKYRDGYYPVEPYYVMVHFPEQDKMEFVIMMPFTPKEKNVITAWMAGRCDMPHYGKIMSFPFPKGVEVLGPKQIEARIDQDTEMSRSLSLWSQRGSDVIRGNLLAIPLFEENTLYIMFVESIFLQAEDAQLPEIKKVALADQDSVVWADDFETSLAKLVGMRAVTTERAAPAAVEEEAAVAVSARVQELIDDAVETFNSYKDALSDANFREAGEHMEELKGLIQDLSEQSGQELQMSEQAEQQAE